MKTILFLAALMVFYFSAGSLKKVDPEMEVAIEPLHKQLYIPGMLMIDAEMIESDFGLTPVITWEPLIDTESLGDIFQQIDPPEDFAKPASESDSTASKALARTFKLGSNGDNN